MRNWTVLKDVTQITALAAIAASLLMIFIETKNENRRNAELLADKVYDDLDIRYIEFLKLTLDYTHLDLLDVPQENPPELTPKEREQQKALYTIVISLLERAHVSFLKDMDSREHQWAGWDHYADNYMKREAFRKTWDEVETEFDLRFQTYMREKFKNRYPEMSVPAEPATAIPNP